MFLGDPVHWRRRYSIAVAGITLIVRDVGSVGGLGSWLASHVWYAALVGSAIGVLAGWDDQGLVSGYVGTLVYVVVLLVSFTRFESTIAWSVPPMVQRAVVTVGIATAMTCLPGYLLGVCTRFVATRWAVDASRS